MLKRRYQYNPYLQACGWYAGFYTLKEVNDYINVLGYAQFITKSNWYKYPTVYVIIPAILMRYESP